MTSGQKLHFWILVFFSVFLLEEAVDVYPQFTCGPLGLKHDINQTEDGKPQVTCLRPWRQSVHLDAHVQIECEVISGTFANITWFHNGTSLSELKKSFVTIDKRSCGQTLKIRYASSHDEGKYTCAATNKFGTVNKTCSLHIKVPINKTEVEYFKIADNRQTAYLNGTVELKCKLLHVDAHMWLLNGTRISHGDRHKMIRDTTICKPRKLFTLKIINVTENDEGRYTCSGYKNGIKAAKDLFLKTEPCPSGYYCPPEGNTAFPFPRSPPTPTPGISRGYSFHRPDTARILLFAVLAFTYNKCK